MTQNDDSLERLNKQKSVTIYLIERENDYSIVSTKQSIKRYLSNVMKRNKGNIVLQNILKGDYTYKILIEQFLYESQEQLGYKIELLKFECKKNKQIEQDLQYGKNEEINVLNKLNRYFQNDIIVMSKNIFSVFDYIGLKSHTLFELKSNSDRFNSYPNAIIGESKVIDYNNQIFLFQYKTETGNGNDLYYFIKTAEFKHLYKTRQIYVKARNIWNTVYDIPRNELTKINENDCMNLPVAMANSDIFDKLVTLDKIGALQNNY